MRKSLLTIGAIFGLVCMPLMTVAKGHAPSKSRQALTAANRKAAAMNSQTVARYFHPETVTSQSFNSEENAWYDSSITKYTYNKAGQILSATNGESQSRYSYDEEGKLVKSEDYVMFEGDYKLSYSTEYSYDPIVKNLVIKTVSTSYDAITGESYGSYVNGYEITRNSDGNITKVRAYYGSGDDKYYNDTLDIEYGADKKAVKITEYDDYDVYTTLTDIVWATTDGQILSYEYDDPNGDMYFSTNRIASATIIDEDHYSEPAKFTATYDGYSYNSKLMAGKDIALEINFKCLEKFADREDFDETYSYDCTSYEAEFEYDEDTETYFIEYTRERTEENRASAFGFVLSNKRVSTYRYANPEYEDETEVDEEKADVTYDETVGYPLTVITYYKSDDADKLVPRSKYTYSDYVNVDPSGVDAVSTDNSAEVEYYNLQGMHIKGNPTPGIYICRKGDKTTKVVIR